MRKNKRKTKRIFPEKQKLISFRVSESEYSLIKNNAASCGLTVSCYIRTLIANGAIIQKDFSGIYEINKIGININQIAKHLNEGHFLSNGDFNLLKEQYENLFDVVTNHIINY